MLVAVPLLALAFLTAVTALDRARGTPSHSPDRPCAPLQARADVRSPPGAKTDIHVKLEFEGFLDGRPTIVKVKVESGLFSWSELGPAYPYHVHVRPLPTSGNCTAALGHLDPQQVTDSLRCDPAFPAFCQTGDLSGKHGRLNGTYSGEGEWVEYEDEFVRWFPREFSLLGRSVVVHAQNGTRIACGNITSPLDGTADASFEPTFAPSTYNSPSSLPTVAFPNPLPFITPINGTEFPSLEYLDALPYPWPHPALTLEEALNVELVESKTIFGDLLPEGVPSDEAPPFEVGKGGLAEGTW